MKDLTIIHNLNQQDILNHFAIMAHEIKTLQGKIESIQIQNDLMSKAETAKFLKCDLSTLNNMRDRGEIVSYGFPGSSRIYFKRSEIESSLIIVKSKRK